MSRKLLWVLALASCLDPQAEGSDRATTVAALDSTLPVEAKILVVAGSSSESELAAIRSVLEHRGVPFDVFVASAEPPLDASRLHDGDHGFYQATIVTASTISLGSAEWAALADYEERFAVRRAVLSATADPALGWGSVSTRDTSSSPLRVRCTTAGEAVFRDVRCDLEQTIEGGVAQRAAAASAALTPLLVDSSGNALAAIHRASDGRESLQLLFRQAAGRAHSELFLHGVLGWVTGGTYLGERRLEMGVQIDDLLLGTIDYPGTYRLVPSDLVAFLDWVEERREEAITPDFHVAFAFNGFSMEDGDPLTETVRAQNDEHWWINHTVDHLHLDEATYAEAYEQHIENHQVAAAMPLIGYDVRNFVPPNISGHLNPAAMRAAYDAGIRYAVTDTSRDGCDNPSPNLGFYSALQPEILLIPRRPTGMGYTVSTPAEWAAEEGASSYGDVLDDVSDTLVGYLARGDADPWMFHRANTRAYDGEHSILGDLIDMIASKMDVRVRVPIRTVPMEELGARFARRLDFETSGVRATLYRGRALLIDAGREVTFPVTGVRAADGEPYGGDVIGLVTVRPGETTCVPLDDAGVGCSPAPTRSGGAGPVSPLPTGYCDGTGGGPPSGGGGGEETTAITPGSTWRYWDRGDLGTSWRARTFDDSAWSSGRGPLGFGESYIETTTTSGRVTYYFRKSFTVADPDLVSGLRGELMYDDGAVVYLNGTEIGRVAMPTGTISASTLSTGHEANDSYTLLDWDAAASLLVEGTNTIAVEVHQQSASSSDVVFDLALVLELSGEPAPEPPPVLDGGVPRGADWWYWDGGGDLGTAWRTSAGGTGWESGGGPLGYGESYLDTEISESSRITTYFTTRFTVADASAITSMIGEVMYDDGFVAYLNGVEVGRAAMPTGAVDASTRSTGHEANNSYVTFDWSAMRGALVDGTNTIAVEVHQASTSSSDLVFDLSLTLEEDGDPPPPPPAGDGGVTRNASWWYWDGGGDLGTAWRTQTTGGTGWESGSGVLGYGESYIDTPISQSSRITTYFTTTFTVDDASAVSSMIGEVLYDDGFVAYLNGVEIGRAAMPTGAVDASTRSTGHEANDAYETFDWSAGLGALRDGTNVVAVEVHQASSSSSDLVFDLALILGAGGDPPPPPPPAGEDINRGSTWRYWDRSTAPSSSWKQPSFDDAAWSSGAGPLGYGESYLATTVSYGGDASHKTISTYFRNTFTVESPSSAATLHGELLYDDGAVVYLNGTEIARLAMPSGTITSTTLSTGHESGRYEDFDWSAFRELLVDGTNVIAVEVHQQDDSSSDLAFDLSLDVTP